MSISVSIVFAVVSEGDAEEADTPERADRKGEQTAVENNRSPLFLDRFICSCTAPRALMYDPLVIHINL